jgi:NAD(P)H-flavin reductase
MKQVSVLVCACLSVAADARRLQSTHESSLFGVAESKESKELAALLLAMNPAIPSPASRTGNQQLLQQRGPHKLCVSRAGRVYCGWGPDPIWTSLEIEAVSDAADDLVDIKIKPPAETAKGFTVPGQYLQIKQPGAEKAGIFAIASAPDAEPFEFLIKEAPPSDWSPGTAWLTGASAGTAVEMSQVMGSGFKFAEHLNEVERVLLFAVGSGISPIRSVIESGALKGKEVELYYGAQTPEKMAYQSKFEEWKKLGVDITPVISQAEGTDWKGKTGYVQDVAEAAGAASKDPSKTLALLCGMKGMAEGVKKLCPDAGIDESRVLANF